VGGGFAGVETVGAINDLARESLAHYGRIDPREVRVVLIGGKVILSELGEALGQYAQKAQRASGRDQTWGESHRLLGGSSAL
jgi:NADH dehydrogenase